MVRFLFYFCFFFCLITGLNYSQTRNIESRQKELQDLRGAIKKLENDMQSKSKKEKKTSVLLEQYNRKTHLISKLINTLKFEEEQKNLLIENNEALLKALSSKTGSVKRVYSRFLTGYYLQGMRNPYSYITDSLYLLKSRLPKLILKAITPASKVELQRLDTMRFRTLAIQAELVKTRIEREEILNDKVKEEKYLAVQMKEKQSLLDRIKKDKNLIAQEIDAKRQAEQRIHSLIAQLVAEAQKKAEARQAALIAKANKEKNKAKSQTQSATEPIASSTKESNIPLLPSSNFKGKLLSPVKSGTIIRRYGQSKNETLNTVTINYGIDIRATGDNSVRASGDGEVSAIDWIPGYGTVIIVSHGKDLRTVYGRVTDVAVREGQTISSGAVIGRVSDSVEGEVLHYEVWNNRKSQNPESWIGRF